MRAKFLWATAFAMVFLVVTIPFYVADAFADSAIDRVIYPSPSGANNASGFMMSSDTLTILVNLRLDGVAPADAAT
ncbi:MAG: hypothetical protein NTY99_02200, partial [DPANN group archaeon]|nr:hypothetical protein [DPANN group archaeon]